MHQLLVGFDGFLPIVTVLFPTAVLIGAASVTLRSRLWRSVSTPHDPVIDALLVYFVLFVAFMVLTPQPDIESRVQLIPGDDLWLALRAAPGDTQPWLQLAGNLMLLFPLGALLPLRISWLDTLLKVALAGVLVSCVIEFAQWMWVGGRVASSDDVILNTVGATLGGMLVRGPWWQLARTRRARVTTGVTRPQHSFVGEDGQTVWRLIEKIEDERDTQTQHYPAMNKQLREPARHP